MKTLLLNRMFIAVSVIACVNFFSFRAIAFSGSGTGTYVDPYQITSADQLYEVRTNLSASYKLMADIDLTDWIAANGLPSGPRTGWPGIGTNITAGTYFSGNFDGNGHTITGIWLTSTDYWNGLFRTVGGTVEIKNLGVVVPQGKSILSSRYVAGIVGYAAAGSSLTISSCYVQGDISATDKTAGALVGYSMGNTTLNNCYAGNGTITHGSNNDGSGGLMGMSYGPNCVTKITNCYAANSVTTSGTGYAAGIFAGASDVSGGGLGIDITISNCVAINPSITGASSSARMFCYKRAGAITYTNNFAYDGTQVNSNLVLNGLVDNSGGQNKSIAELTTQDTYVGMGWDFDNVWKMGTGNNLYPVLKNVPFVVAGIESPSKLKTKVYYNSQSGNILVEAKSIGEVVSVYDYQGRLMLKSGESVLNISNFSKGIYLVNMSGNSTKIIKN